MCTFSIVTFVLVFSLALANVQADYARLNKFLLAHSKDENVAANMEAAVWLREQKGRLNSLFSAVPIADLNKFTALQQVIDDKECDGSVYEIMRANDEAVRLYKLEDEPARIVRRVDRVIFEIFKGHAQRCDQVYPQKYQKYVGLVDAKMAERAASLANTLLETDRSIIPERVFYQPQNLFERYAKKGVSVRRYFGSNALKHALVVNAKEDPDIKYLHKVADDKTGKKVVRKDKIKELVQNYIIEPCRQFIEVVGTHVFTPAKFDSRFYSKVDKTSNLDYYLTWSSHTICKALIEYDEVVLLDVTRSVDSGN